MNRWNSGLCAFVALGIFLCAASGYSKIYKVVQDTDGTYRVVDPNPDTIWTRLVKMGRVLDPTAPRVPTTHTPTGFGQPIHQSDMEIGDSPAKQAVTGIADTANMVPVVNTVTKPFTEALNINSQPASTQQPQTFSTSSNHSASTKYK